MEPDHVRASKESSAAAAPATAAAHSYAGFDSSVYPGDERMKVWRAASPYVFAAWYLPSPARPNASWSGTRERLELMEWGLAVVYTARSSAVDSVDASSGLADGVDAASKAEAEGFARGSAIFLDIPPGEPAGEASTAYLRAWFEALARAGYRPSLRCDADVAVGLHALISGSMASGSGEPLIWVRQQSDAFDCRASNPAGSGIPFAVLWQGCAAAKEVFDGERLTVALNVASIRNPSQTGATLPAAPPLPLAARRVPPLERVNRVIQKHLHQLEREGVIQVRAGFRVAAGRPTGEPAIVVKVLNKDPGLPAAAHLPRSIEGIPVDVRQATPFEQLKVFSPAAAAALERTPEFESPQWEYDYGQLASIAAFAARALPRVPYRPASVPLDEVNAVLSINCHASPDCGWQNLKPFLEATGERLTVGMYDFGAPHIVEAFSRSVSGKQLTMVLDSNPAGPDEHPLQESLANQLGPNLRFAWAPEATSPDVSAAIFPNAYHIKVAVRDGKSMWLSSGNWMNSNQPDIDPINKPGDRIEADFKNREWHVIVDHEGLASVYEKYLENDLEQALPLQRTGVTPFAAVAAGVELFVEEVEEVAVAAAALPRRFFKPLLLGNKKVRIQPLLTPDNFAPHILSLIGMAKKRFYMQMQYVHAQDSSPEVLKSLVQAIQSRIQAGVDVRIIVHEREAKSDWIERLQSMGFDTSVIRVQAGIHNKGIVVDSRIAVVGSQNWSGDGVSRNRDASLILTNGQIARYFEKIFLHDWTRLARPYVHRPARILVAKPGQAPPPGFRRVTLAEYMSE